MLSDDEKLAESLDADLLVLSGDGVLNLAVAAGPLGVGGLFLEAVLGVALNPPPLLLVTLISLLILADSEL